jgi:hypothetical protein
MIRRSWGAIILTLFWLLRPHAWMRERYFYRYDGAEIFYRYWEVAEPKAAIFWFTDTKQL